MPFLPIPSIRDTIEAFLGFSLGFFHSTLFLCDTKPESSFGGAEWALLVDSQVFLRRELLIKRRKVEEERSQKVNRVRKMTLNRKRMSNSGNCREILVIATQILSRNEFSVEGKSRGNECSVIPRGSKRDEYIPPEIATLNMLFTQQQIIYLQECHRFRTNRLCFLEYPGEFGFH